MITQVARMGAARANLHVHRSEDLPFRCVKLVRWHESGLKQQVVRKVHVLQRARCKHALRVGPGVVQQHLLALRERPRRLHHHSLPLCARDSPCLTIPGMPRPRHTSHAQRHIAARTPYSGLIESQSEQN